jgi:xylulokinase
MPIHVPPPDEYVALGAARQAAWALSGAMNPPTWITGDSQLFTATPTPGARTRYAKLRDATTHWEW